MHVKFHFFHTWKILILSKFILFDTGLVYEEHPARKYVIYLSNPETSRYTFFILGRSLFCLNSFLLDTDLVFEEHPVRKCVTWE